MQGFRPDDQGWGRGRRPVIGVSWADVNSYLKLLSSKVGKNYRLLSESEWEYCCRGGTVSSYSFGDEEGDLGGYAWYKANSGGKTHPVGEKGPNRWGLYDMHGNVGEWCMDRRNRSYKNKPDALKGTGAAWTAGDADGHIIRGGSWSYDPEDLRCASRGWMGEDSKDYVYGFRVARAITT
jgi:formylglycine-generating enzyme required for sulfatase activity